MDDFLEIVKVGGPVTAVSMVFLWYFDRLDKRTKELIENHLQHMTEALNKNSKVLEKLSTLINRMMKNNKK